VTVRLPEKFGRRLPGFLVRAVSPSSRADYGRGDDEPCTFAAAVGAPGACSAAGTVGLKEWAACVSVLGQHRAAA
jgi:hypothetical protein